MNDEQVDVAVVGLGIMGASALWRLARRGLRVVGIDRFESPNAMGSSQGETRMLRTAVWEGDDYVPWIRRSCELWRELEQESGRALLSPIGVLLLGARDGAFVEGSVAALRGGSFRYELLSRGEMAERFPQHRLDDGDVGVLDRDGGVLGAEASVAAALAAARAHGAAVSTGAAVEELSAAGGAVTIAAGERRWQADHVVVAAGAWLPQLLPELACELRIERHVYGWFATDGAPAFAPERCPAFMRGADLYGFPAVDGATIKVGFPVCAGPTSVDAIVRSVQREELEAMRLGLIAPRLNGVGAPVAGLPRSYACMTTNTPDRDFLIGAPAGMPWLTVLGGFSGHGFKYGPAVGETAAELVVDGASTLPVARFSPDRFVAAA